MATRVSVTCSHLSSRTFSFHASQSRAHETPGRQVELTLLPEYFLSGGTALHLAAEAGHLEVMEALLKAGADPEIRDEKGKSSWLFNALTDCLCVCQAMVGVPKGHLKYKEHHCSTNVNTNFENRKHKNFIISNSRSSSRRSNTDALGSVRRAAGRSSSLGAVGQQPSLIPRQ